MSDWQRCKFSELLQEPLRNGIYKKKEFHGHGAKVINMGELFRFSRLQAIPMKRVELNDSERIRFGVQTNDLLFARRSLVAEGAGKCSIVMDVDEVTTFESSIIRARPNEDKAISLFYYYYFGSPRGLHSLDTIRRQVAVAGITGTDLSNLIVPIPPIGEQRAISSILGALDDKIDLNRRMNETLEAMARAIFKDWFVDFGPTRAKAEGRAPYLAPELWELFPETLDEEGTPLGWKRKPLDDVADFLNGLALQKFPASNPLDSLPVIKIAELRGGITAKTSWASRNVPGKYVIKDGDFLFSWSGSLLAKFWTGGEGALNQHLFKVTSERYPGWFFSQWIHHHLLEFQAIAASKATTMGHIRRGDLTAAMTVCPPDDLLEMLDPTLGLLQRATIGNQLENRTLTRTRNLLLSKLMSGEIRIEEAGEAI